MGLMQEVWKMKLENWEQLSAELFASDLLHTAGGKKRSYFLLKKRETFFFLIYSFPHMLGKNLNLVPDGKIMTKFVLVILNSFSSVVCLESGLYCFICAADKMLPLISQCYLMI